MIKPLTSLRFIFALMVFASHLGFLEQSDSYTLRCLFNTIFFEGYIGVSFFFILSGFILSYSYQKKITNKKSNLRNFYIARFARIYPMHILCFIAAIPLTLNELTTNTPHWLLKALSNLTLTQSFVPKSSFYFTFNSPSWSISDEMFFYLLFPLIIPLFSKLKKGIHITAFISLIFIAIITLINITPEQLQHSLFYIHPAARIFDFTLGILIFNLFRIHQTKRILIPKYWEYVSILLFAIFFSLHNNIPIVYRYSVYYWIPTSFIIYTFAWSKGKLSKLLSTKAFVRLGEASFGFYMIHQLIIRYFFKINDHFFFLNNEFLIISILLSLSIFLSIKTNRWFEIPLNTYVKRKLNYKR